MRKSILTIALALFTAMALYAQSTPAGNDDDIIKVNYQKKSVSTALILSCAVPGLGQFYGNYRSFTTYLFPIIEVGLWMGYISYDQKGSDIEKDYKKFADEHYNRDYQSETSQILCDVIPSSNPDGDDLYNGIGPDKFFRLDDSNSQHYYEDIGKYNQYIFGWTDWHDKYVDDNGNIYWAWDNYGADDPNHKWLGNYPVDNPDQENPDEPYSAFRDHYDAMRNDAETNFDKSGYFGVGLVFNHILAGIDAVRVTRKYNEDYLSQRPLDIHLKTICRSDRLTPMLVIGHQF